MVVAVIILDRHSGEVIQGPELFTKGFLTMEDADDVLEDAKKSYQAAAALDHNDARDALKRLSATK